MSEDTIQYNPRTGRPIRNTKQPNSYSTFGNTGNKGEESLNNLSENEELNLSLSNDDLDEDLTKKTAGKNKQTSKNIKDRNPSLQDIPPGSVKKTIDNIERIATPSKPSKAGDNTSKQDSNKVTSPEIYQFQLPPDSIFLVMDDAEQAHRSELEKQQKEQNEQLQAMVEKRRRMEKDRDHQIFLAKMEEEKARYHDVKQEMNNIQTARERRMAEQKKEKLKRKEDTSSRNSCLNMDSKCRISVGVALEHPFLQHSLNPEFVDLAILPTRILRLLNVLEETDLAGNEIEDIIADIRDGCLVYGDIEKLIVPKNGIGKCKVFIEFKNHTNCISAFDGMCTRTFNGRSIVATYFPPDDFAKGNLY